MPGCILRADGTTFQVGQFLEGSRLVPYVVFRKGEPRTRAGTGKDRKHKTSGMNVVVAESDTLTMQIRCAIAFLKRYKRELIRLRRYRGVDGVCLDFGITCGNDWVAHFDSLPPELLRLAGRLDIGIELSRYITTAHR